MCITYKLGSGVGLSQNFRHSPSLKIVGDIEGEFWKWRFGSWHTTPYEMCHLSNCHNTSCGSCASMLEWIYPSRHTPDAQSIPSVSVMSSRTYVNLDVYVHMIAHISTRCKYMCVCWQVSTRWFETISTRFPCSYSIWDVEWWWESRLESSCRNLDESYYEMSESRLEKLYESRLVFYVWIPRFFRPVGWQTALFMLRSLSTQVSQGFRLDSTLITYRFRTDYSAI